MVHKEKEEQEGERMKGKCINIECEKFVFLSIAKKVVKMAFIWVNFILSCYANCLDNTGQQMRGRTCFAGCLLSRSNTLDYMYQLGGRHHFLV